jgi:hypothetical protein
VGRLDDGHLVDAPAPRGRVRSRAHRPRSGGPGFEEGRVVVRRLGALGALAFLSVLLGSFVVVLTAAPIGGGLAWDTVGVAAAGGTLAIVAWLAHRAT